MDEDKITIDNLPYLFDNTDNKEFHFTLNHVGNGTYIVKTKFMNDHYGSVQNEWKNYQGATDLTIGELDYFKQISTPRMQSAKIIVTDNKLDFNSMLSANEIRLVEIVKD